jgi:hypothetical protein
MCRRRTPVRRFLSCTALVLALAFPSSLASQDQDAARKRLWQSFEEARRKGRGETARAGSPVERLVGITLWRPHATDPAVPAPRLLPGATIADGERIRLGVEVAGPAYVYVIKRALLAGGALGPPYLVFPTPRGRPSANVAAPGRLIEVPDRGDLASGFTLARSGPEHAGERFTVLLTSSPLNAPPGGGPNPLPAPLVAAWERRALTPAGRVDAPQLLVPQLMPAETASATGTRVLGSGDVMPQSIVQVRAPVDEPVAFSLEVAFQ